MATGGFSPKNASIAAYPSGYLQYVVIISCFWPGPVSPALVRPARQTGGLLAQRRVPFYSLIIIFATLLIMANRMTTGTAVTEASFRGTLFHVVSTITTTGFVTEDYGLWPIFAQLLLLVLMFFGGCTSSTGGGSRTSASLFFSATSGPNSSGWSIRAGYFPSRLTKNPSPSRS